MEKIFIRDGADFHYCVTILSIVHGLDILVHRAFYYFVYLFIVKLSALLYCTPCAKLHHLFSWSIFVVLNGFPHTSQVNKSFNHDML